MSFESRHTRLELKALLQKPTFGYYQLLAIASFDSPSAGELGGLCGWMGSQPMEQGQS